METNYRRQQGARMESLMMRVVQAYVHRHSQRSPVDFVHPPTLDLSPWQSSRHR